MAGIYCTTLVGLVIMTFCKANPLCNGTYEETIFPKLYNSGTPVDLNNVKDYTTLTLVFTWRNGPMNILLEQHSVVSEESVVEVHADDTVESERLTDNRTHFQGHVLGARFSFVALAVGNSDVTGYVQFDGEGIYIEPMEQGQGHLNMHRAHSCGYSSLPRRRNGRLNGNNAQKRYRRAPDQYTKFLEVLLVADSTVVQVVGPDRVNTYLMTLMSIVNEIYHDRTLGVNIEVVTVKIIFMDESTERHVIVTSDPQRTVDQFCYWASTQSYRSRRYARQTEGSNHDTAVLLTRHKFSAAGYAPITGMCIPMRNCAFVKDDGFTSAFVIAHEVGHIFGLMHDGHGNTCYGREYTTSIMATMVQSAFNRYWWSGCSKSRMQEVIGPTHVTDICQGSGMSVQATQNTICGNGIEIKERGLTCLNNNPHHVIKEDLPQPLGLKWTLDEQCMFEFGMNARHCRIFGANDPCAQMWCSDGYAYQCKTKNVIPLDGTQCGASSQYYCMRGVCGYHGNAKPIKGNWGQWSQWSDCSADCGIGFKRRSRLCDSPKPQFGGRECDGESENADTCKSKTCTDYEDPRAYQCSVMDIVPVKGATHIWLPYQVDNLADRCKLTCISQSSNEVVTFDSLVDNGTPCSYDNFNSICIDGKCQHVGCDGIRGSQAQEDSCGICQGDGSSCKTVAGVYSKKFQYGAAGHHYEKMLVLPKGSRAISISEKGMSPHFMSVQDTLYLKHVFNADGKQGTSKNFALEGAWFKYHNNAGYETLDAKGPIQRDVNVMIYPMDWQRPANVRYSYTVDKNDYTYEKNKYQWKFEAWSECSVTCADGVQHIIYACHDKETGDTVEDDYCKFLESPNTDDVKCSRLDCASFLYIWRMLRNHSECSASCGDEGTRHLLFECEEKDTQRKFDNAYCVHIPEPKVVSPCNRFPCTQVSYRWEVTSDWSDCSASCDTSGTQFQLFYCLREIEGSEDLRVDEKFCSDMVSPKEPRPCNRIPCLKYDWKIMDEWLDCNETCGQSGIQKKKVVCHKYELGETEKPVGIWYCQSKQKPTETRTCNIRQCFTFKWEETDEFGECSKTCGNTAIKQMKLYCNKVMYDNRESRVPDTLCKELDTPNVDRKCENMVPCVSFEWEATYNWTKCSQSCGKDGIQSRIHKCISVPSEEEVSDSFCKSSIIVSEEKPCNRIPCVQYVIQYIDEWYPDCSKECVDEPIKLQSRKTKCFQLFDYGRNEITDDKFCQGLESPTPMIRPCDPLSCPKFGWEEDGWGPCSESCGMEGNETQLAMCIELTDNGTRRVVGDSKCEHLRRLDLIQRPCRLPSCLRYKSESDWSDCSVTCGIGIRSKHVICVHKSPEGTEEEVKTDICVKANITKPIEKCDAGPCRFMEWGAGSWSMCSKTCGLGKRKRIVYCGDPLKNADPSSCPGQQPSEYQDCKMEPCKAGARTRCRGNRAAFCKRANTRLCHHPAYRRVCCASCEEFQQDQPRRSRYRKYLNTLRRQFRRNG